MLLMLLLGWWAEHRWVFADVVDERRESWVPQQGLNQGSVSLIFLQQSSILIAEAGTFLGFQGDFAFKLRDVF